jgi:hypothetical protein
MVYDLSAFSIFKNAAFSKDLKSTRLSDSAHCGKFNLGVYELDGIISSFCIQKEHTNLGML